MGLERLAMILRIFVPSVRSRSFRLVATHILCTLFNVYLAGKVISSLPGQLQGLAIQSDRPGYINATIRALGFRLLSAAGTFCASSWTGNAIVVEWQSQLTHHLVERTMAEDGCFYLLRHVDKRICDMETRMVADVALLSTATQSMPRRRSRKASSAGCISGWWPTAKASR